MTSHRLRSLLVAASLLVPAVAHAQATPATPPSVPSGSVTRTAGEYTTVITERGELSELEARTAADMIGGELVKHKARPGSYDVSFGRLGSRTRLVISNGGETREAWMASLDELQPASARTVEALSTGRTVGETENVDNVLASETTTRRTKPGQLGAGLNLIGATPVGVPSGLSTGFGVFLHYNTARYSLVAEGRAVGIGSSDQKLAEVSAGIGARFFFSDAEFSPFAGGGLQVAYYNLSKSDSGGSGAAAYAELGLAGLRSNKVGVYATVRGAAPFFMIADDKYVVPLTLNLGLTFL